MNDMHTYPYKYGELKVLAQWLAEDVKRDHNRRATENRQSPYSEVLTYDKAKRVLKLLEDQANRSAS